MIRFLGLIVGIPRLIRNNAQNKDVSGDTKKNAVDRRNGCCGGWYFSGGGGTEAHCLVIDPAVL
jgi:hypothetical protein